MNAPHPVPFQVTEPPHRTPLHAIGVHLGTRLKHAALTWLYLKPLLLRDLSQTYERPFPTHPAPQLERLPYFVIKLQWFVAAFFQQQLLMWIPYVGSGLFHLNHLLFAALEKRMLRQTQKRSAQVEALAPAAALPRTLPLPEFDWRKGSAQEFIENFVRKPFPVVLRGFGADSPARQEFTFQNIIAKYGDETVLLTTHKKDGFEGPLREVLKPGIYCHNSESLFIRHPELLPLLNYAQLEQYSDGMKAAYSQLFIGRGGTGSPFHCAAVWNWFHMLDGRKRWHFADPNHSLFLYPVASMGQLAATAHCSFPDKYDRKNYPLFEHCPLYVVELEPGDVLFIPAWWWHCVENLTEESVAVASRWHTTGIAGHDLMWTEENYDISRFLSVLLQIGFASPARMHGMFTQPSPLQDEHTTLRERRNRFIDKHYKMAAGKMFGIHHKL